MPPAADDLPRLPRLPDQVTPMTHPDRRPTAARSTPRCTSRRGLLPAPLAAGTTTVFGAAVMRHRVRRRRAARPVGPGGALAARRRRRAVPGRARTADPVYYEARPSIAIPPSAAGQGRLVRPAPGARAAGAALDRRQAGVPCTPPAAGAEPLALLRHGGGRGRRPRARRPGPAGSTGWSAPTPTPRPLQGSTWATGVPPAVAVRPGSRDVRRQRRRTSGSPATTSADNDSAAGRCEHAVGRQAPDASGRCHAPSTFSVVQTFERRSTRAGRAEPTAPRYPSGDLGRALAERRPRRSAATSASR